MAEYLTPIDIANRALDHCGIPNIAAFTDNTKAADRTNAVYDKLRTAELRRNVWRFAVRKMALRAVDTCARRLPGRGQSVKTTLPNTSPAAIF